MKIFSRTMKHPDNDPLLDFDAEPARSHHDEQWLQARRQRRIRRSIGVLVALAMVAGAVWVVGYSGLADPVLVAAAPVIDFFKEAADDPKGAFMMFAALFITKIGILAFIFDERNY